MAKEYIFKLDYALYNEETGEAVFKPQVVCELVRCGECIYRSQTLTHSWCTNSKSCCHGCLVRKDFFCADGKRKDGAE